MDRKGLIGKLIVMIIILLLIVGWFVYSKYGGSDSGEGRAEEDRVVEEEAEEVSIVDRVGVETGDGGT